MIKSTFVTFVRHGENEEYLSNEPKYPGPGLTLKGKKEAKKTAEFLKGFKFDRIYCSDMTRAIETANEIKKGHFSKISYHRELAEINQMVFDLSFEEKEPDPKHLKINLKRAKEGRDFFKKVLKKNNGKIILIIGHGNAISSFIGFGLRRSIKDTPRLSLKNCSISSVMFKNEKIILISHIGLMDHLKRDRFAFVMNETSLDKLLK